MFPNTKKVSELQFCCCSLKYNNVFSHSLFNVFVLFMLLHRVQISAQACVCLLNSACPPNPTLSRRGEKLGAMPGIHSAQALLPTLYYCLCCHLHASVFISYPQFPHLGILFLFWAEGRGCWAFICWLTPTFPICSPFMSRSFTKFQRLSHPSRTS